MRVVLVNRVHEELAGDEWDRMPDPSLEIFHPAVAQWFHDSLGEPTPVQRAGWPSIAAGNHSLLLAPTGSGKTLAAFLACLDFLWRNPPPDPSIKVLYISPLKALNNDIYRNLQMPLEGVLATARHRGEALPRIEVAVRTGDTPTAERQRMLRKPPHVLITTPESLHLLLTSKAREVLGNLSYCIVDEIHSLCPNKRGVFLALLLERLQTLNPQGFVRIGLSATMKPLDELARYLGGQTFREDGTVEPRPVKIIDAGLRKNLDLRVISPVEQFGPLPERSIWPSIYRLIAKEILAHRSTIVFANNRRSVERITREVNTTLADLGVEANGENEPITPNIESGIREVGPVTSVTEEIQVRAHHGSVSLEMRQQTEQALKEGRLRAVVATASLELGIDMGAVDLVIQVESPGNVTRGLQRVGRAGHLVGQHSQGRLVPKTLPDLLNEAVLAGEMKAGNVEALRAPTNCLDILAQQIVAMTAMEDWKVDNLFRVVRQAYPFRELTASALDAVLQMITGRFRFTAQPDEGTARVNPAQQMSALQPRISWDRVHERLQALPGSQRLALAHGGTIPDMGQYAVYTHRGQRIGELDEEFVFERRIGDAFILGTNTWRLDKIEVDRVLVVPAEGAPAMVPFWHGENVGRSYDLGVAQGRFLAAVRDRLDDPALTDWLQSEHCLDANSARNVRDFVRRQVARTECVPDHQTVWIEANRDPLGDWQVLILTPLGSRIHLGLRLALEVQLYERLGYRPQCLHHDDGVLIRLTESDEPVLDVLAGLTPENVRRKVVDALADSALFALRFRHNAARALMMPRGSAGKRSPLWLQRLRGRDLLQVARQYPDFPIVAETFRECLNDYLDVPRLETWLASVQDGSVAVKSGRLEMPSPFAATLLFSFTMAYMYHYDDVDPEPGRTSSRLDQALLEDLTRAADGALSLDPRAIGQVDRRLRGVGMPPRSVAEMAEWLRRLGDVALEELEGPMRGFLEALQNEGRVQELELAGTRWPRRWVLTEEKETYQTVFSKHDGEANQEAGVRILHRYLETHALVGLRDVLDRYPFDETWAKRQLNEWAKQGRLIVIAPPSPGEPTQWSAPVNFEQMQRSTLAILRHEVVSCPGPQFQEFVLRWHHAHPLARGEGGEGIAAALVRLEGIALPTELWEASILPTRIIDFRPALLDTTLATGAWTWRGIGRTNATTEELAFWQRATLAQMTPPAPEEVPLSPMAQQVFDQLRHRGATFTAELGPEVPTVRAALWELVRLGLVTNDQFEVIRKGEPVRLDMAPDIRSRRELRSFLRNSTRRPEPFITEGRWSVLNWGPPEPERTALTQARLLLDRYGIVARELAALDASMPAWRVLYEVYSRLELSGEIRRGYFVEGLSGAQFALAEAIEPLQAIASPSNLQAPLILLHSMDPANLYGVGAPFENSDFSRRAGNWIVLKAGKPVLFIEQQGRKLTPALGTLQEDLERSIALVPNILNRSGDPKQKLTVETWNGETVTGTEARAWLEKAGFVRDYQAMTWYAVWASPSVGK